MIVTIPVDVTIERNYRAYVTMDIPGSSVALDEIDEEEIVKLAKKKVVEEQDDALMIEEGVKIQRNDILLVEPDWDGIMLD